MNSIITIFAIVVGWALNELSQFIRMRHSHSRAISHALSILLEVRYQAVCIEHLIDKFKKIGLEEKTMPYMRQVMDTLMPNSESLNNEYEDAIRKVSEESPLLAYEFRSKASISTFFSNYRNIALQSGASPESFELVESQLRSLIIPRLNELVLQLAKVHSKKSCSEVQRILESPIELPGDFEEIIDNFQKANN